MPKFHSLLSVNLLLAAAPHWSLATLPPKTPNCTEVTYYELDHGRFMFAPLDVVKGYGNILGAQRGYAPECAGGKQPIDFLIGPATNASNQTTESTSIGAIKSNALASTNSNSTAVAVSKRAHWGFGALGLFMGLIGFSGGLMGASCVVQVTEDGAPDKGTSTYNNCVVGAYFIIAATVYNGAANVVRNAPGTYEAATDLYQYLRGRMDVDAWAAWEYMMNHLNAIGQGRRDGTESPQQTYRRLLETDEGYAKAHQISLNGVALNTTIGFKDYQGRDHTLATLMGADHISPLVVHGSHQGTNYTSGMWLAEHPFNSSKTLLHFKTLPVGTDGASGSASTTTGSEKEKRQNTWVGGNSPVYVGAYDQYLYWTGNDETGTGLNPMIYFGMDFYFAGAGTALGQAFGSGANNAATTVQSDADVVTEIVESQAWDSCLCWQELGDWIATGSVQFSWDKTYNGYSACFAADCDGA